jgi:hypothetical protein
MFHINKTVRYPNFEVNLRYLFGVKLIRSQGGWIRSSSGPLLTEQAVEGVREDALRPLKTNFINNCGTMF